MEGLTPTPSAQVHATNGLDCWCNPLYLVACDDCEGAGCWKCDDGSRTLSRAEAEAPGVVGIVVVHNQEPTTSDPTP